MCLYDEYLATPDDQKSDFVHALRETTEGQAIIETFGSLTLLPGFGPLSALILAMCLSRELNDLTDCQFRQLVRDVCE